MFPARIASTRRAGDVTVALVNNFDVEDYSSFLTNERLRTHNNFGIPFEVTAGSIINIVSKTNSSDTLCTAVSLNGNYKINLPI